MVSLALIVGIMVVPSTALGQALGEVSQGVSSGVTSPPTRFPPLSPHVPSGMRPLTPGIPYLPPQPITKADYTGFGIEQRAVFLGVFYPPLNPHPASLGIRPPVALSAGPLTYSNGTYGWNGLNDNAPNNCGCTPPDTTGSAGNGYVVEGVNNAYQVWTTAGVNKSTFNGNVLFATTDGLSDPNIHYDPMSGRWFAEEISVTNYGDSYLAVSQTSDPTGAWWTYMVYMPNHTGTSGDLPDQINIGVSENILTLSGNDFAGGGSFAGAVTFIINKTQAMAGTSPTYIIDGPWASYASLHAGEALANTNTVYYLSSNFQSSTVLNYFSITGSEPTHTLAFKNYSTTSTAPGTPTFSGGYHVATNDNRIGSAVWRAGDMWAAANDGVCSGTVQSCIHVWEVNTTTNTKVSDFIWTDGTADAYYPAVTLDASGNVGILFSTSTSSTYPSVGITGRALSDSAGTLETATIVKPGTGVGSEGYPTTSQCLRFGDYSGAATDLSSGTMWGFGEWMYGTKTTGCPTTFIWGTWVQSFTFPSAGGTVPVTFQESGLPSGTNWTVTFNSQLHQSTGINITFNESAGTDPYTVLTPIAGTPGTQYVDGSPTGSLTFSKHTTQPVTFGTQYHVTTSASPAAGGTVTPAGGWQSSGASVTFAATPKGGYAFTTWVGNGTGATSSTTNPYTIASLGGPVTEVADFAATSGTVPVTFTQTTLPATTSWSVYLGTQVGTATGHNITFNVSTGSYGYTVPTISFGPGEQYLPAPASGSLSVTKHVATTIAFTTQYYLTVSANPVSEGTVSPASGWNNAAALVTISSTPNSGYVLASWSGTGSGSYSGTSPSTSITMNGPITEIGNFQAAPAGTVPVSFLETGLPATTSWSTVFAGLYGSSTGRNITFNVSSSTYTYAVATVSTGVGSQYVPAPTGGSLAISKHTSQAVTFSAQYYLSTSANPSVGGLVTPVSGWYAAATPVTITATANGGYGLLSWSGSGTGSYSGTSTTSSVTLNNPIDEIANFQSIASTIPVSFLETGLSAGTFWSATFNSVTYSSYGSNITFNVTASTYPYAIPVVSGGSGTQYNPAPGSGSLSITKHTSTAVTFTEQYYLTTSANPSAEGSATPASGWQNAASPVTLTATPNGGFSFSGWSGTGTGSYSGTSASTGITMNGPITEIANFGPVSNAVPVSFRETGLTAGTLWTATLGTQSASSTGLNITFNVTAATYPYSVSPVTAGSGVQYSPSPSSGSLPVTVHTTQSVVFAEQYYLTMSANPPGDGTVAPGSGWVAVGSPVSISATAAGGYSFSSWSGTGTGNYSGGASSTFIPMNGPITEIGNFQTSTPRNVPVTFTESTLPLGTAWSVTLGGTLAGTATGQNITFNVTTNTYPYSVATVTTGAGIQYVPSPASGSLTVTAHTSTAVSFAAQYYLTMSADPASEGTVSPASAWFASGSSFPITETPNVGYLFSSWSGTGTGSYSGTATSPTITMSGPVTEIGNFQSPSSGTIPVSFLETGLPAGTSWSVTFNGIGSSSTGLNITFNVTAGTYAYSIATVAQGSGTQYVPSPASGSQTVTSYTTTTVAFAAQYYLTLSVNPSPDGTVSPASGWQPLGSTPTISATANAGYTFVSWSGSGAGNYSGTAASQPITMNGPITEIANFAVTPGGTVPVTFLETGLVAGTTWSVTLNGIVGSSGGLNITFNVTSGSYSYSIATPIGGGPGTQYVPTQPSGTLSVGATHLVQPVTYLAQYQLTTYVTPVGSGNVTPAGGWYLNGTNVTLTATSPSFNFYFNNWTCSGTGCYAGSADPVVLTMTAAVNETANFLPYIPLNFTETGLPTGTSWSLTLGGLFTTSSTGPTMLIDTSAGSMTYAVAKVSVAMGVQYVPSPASGTLNVVSPTWVNLTFTEEAYVTMIANPGSAGTVSPSSGWYTVGTPVPINEVPGTSMAFVSWTGTGVGSYNGTAATASVTPGGPITEIANYQTAPATVPVTFLETGMTTGTSWSVTLDGTVATASGANITFNVTSGTHGYYLASVAAGTWTQFAVSSPSPNGTVNAGASGASVAVTFTEQFLVTTSSNPSGGGVAGPASGWVDAATVVTLTATPNIGYSFSAWAGTGTNAYSGSSNPASITVVAGINETAYFVPAQTYLVSLNATGVPPGTSWWVALDGQNVSGLSTIQFRVPDGTYTYTAESPIPGGTGVRYVAAQSSGSVTVSGADPATIQVVYSTQYFLAISVAPSQSGTVLPGNAWVNAGSSVTLTAYPFAGYAFSAWSGAYSGPNNPVTVTAGGPVSETARFTSLSSWIAGTVDPAGANLQIDNVTIPLNASGGFNYTLAAGHHFVEVSASGYQASTLRVLTMTGSGVGLKISLQPTGSGSTTTSIFAASLFPLLLLLVLVIAIVGAILGYLIGRKRKKEPVSAYPGSG